MRILHILDHSLPLHSGYTFRSDNIFRVQAKRGWHVTVLTSPKHQEGLEGTCEQFEMVEGFPHFRTMLRCNRRVQGYYEGRLMLALEHRLHEVISKCSPDVIHAHSPALNAIPALRAGRIHKIPVVYEVRAFWEDAAVDHGTFAERSLKYRLVRLLETWACRKAMQVTVICEGLRQDLIGRGLAAEKLTIIRNGIDINEFKQCEKDSEFMASFALEGKKVIGFVGSFYRYEGLDLLVDAFASLERKYGDYVLLLVGGGEMEQSIRAKLKENALEDRVILPGRIPHNRVPGVYAAIDVLAYPRHPMRLTNLVTPLKPLEAMAMGKAVVASDVGGHKELIRDGETGLLFSAGNVSALAASLERLMGDDVYRESLGERGRAWVRKEHPWEKTTAIYETVYDRAIASR